MVQNLSEYAPTRKGVESLVRGLTPTILQLWKMERESKGDDLVAVIDTQANRVFMKPKEVICTQLRRHKNNADLLVRLTKPASSRANGAITIWSIIGFTTGQVCTLPLVIARS